LWTSECADNQQYHVAASNLTLRLLTAAVGAPLLLGLMFFAPPWAWYLLVAAACAVAAAEVFAMTHPGDRVAQFIGVLATLGTSLGIYFYSQEPRLLLSVLLVVPILGALVPLWRLGELPSAGLRMMAGIATPLYIGGLLTTIALLRRDHEPWGAQYVVLTLTFAWLGDTGGYFAGRFLGKHKLYERVSPKKTREGFVGSLAGSCVAGALASLWYLPALPLGHALALALGAGTLGQLGDLAESLLKRSMGVKDSGWIIPGHGGILDRLDAVLLVSPVVLLYLLWTQSPA